MFEILDTHQVYHIENNTVVDAQISWILQHVFFFFLAAKIVHYISCPVRVHEIVP